MNQVVLVGRITDIKKTKNEDVANMVIAVARSLKNDEGIYETDFINVELKGVIALNTLEYCKKGDIVGVKGRVQTTKIRNSYKMGVVAERITFLSSSKDHE